MPPTINSLDLLKGALAKVSVAEWDADGAGTPYFDLGALRDISIEAERTVKQIEADNTVHILDSYPTKVMFTVKATMIEADLRKFALALGDQIGDVTYVDAASATLLIGDPGAVNYFHVALLVEGQSMDPDTTEDDTYSQREYTFWRVNFTTKTSAAFKKDDETVIPVELAVLYDPTMSGADKIGKVVDTV